MKVKVISEVLIFAYDRITPVLYNENFNYCMRHG
jgi:hypothetical protein